MKTLILSKPHALEAIALLARHYKLSPNATLGDIYHLADRDIVICKLEQLRDSFADLTWDTTLGEAREIIESEND